MVKRIQKIGLVSALLLSVSVSAQDTVAPDTTDALTRQDFVAQMDAQFAQFDADGNGMVVAEEIAASQRQGFVAEALRQNSALFGQLDANRDGVLGPEEFARLVNPQAIAVDPGPLMQVFDTDQDGVVTLVEYRIATQANFDRTDSDRNGVITSSEMQAAGITP